MDNKQVRDFLSPQFGLLAKSSGEMLWAHHYATWSIVRKLAHYIPRFQNDKSQLELIELAALVHDIGKMNPEWQNAIKTGKNPPPHKASEAQIADYLTKHLPAEMVSNELIKAVTDISRPHHGPSEKDLAEIDLSSAGFFTQLLTAADWLASMETINGRVVAELAELFESFCKITYAEVSRFPSPTTYILLSVLDDCYREQGFQPLLFLPSGAIFVGPTIAVPMDPEKIIDRAFDRFIELSLSYQQIKWGGFGDLLGGISAMRPDSFLQAKKNEIIEILNDAEQAPGLFLKLLKDIFKNTDRLDEMRQKSPAIDLLAMVSGPRGAPLANSYFEKHFHPSAPDKLSDLITRVFQLSKVEDVIPAANFDQALAKKQLSSLNSNTLFELLMNVASAKESKDPQEEDLKHYLSNLLVLEREMDFEALAEESLLRYSNYKATSNIEKGACERCGCPVAIKPEKGMGFPGGLTKAFSQIKAKPDANRATCVFCAFDNMALRQNMGSGWAPMMLRIDNHIPDLAQHFGSLKEFALKVASATRNPKDLKWGHELETTLPFPIPRRLRVPLADLPQQESTEVVPMGERGLYFKIGAGERDMSVKDERARFRPLYHLLGLLGFRVSIGEEEQDGLLGLAEIPSISMYQRSLVSLLLSAWVKKKDRKHLSAEKMLEQQPSVALMTVADYISQWGGGEPSPQIETFFSALSGAQLIIAIDQTGKEYNMGELLKDAARLASPSDGIQKFCERPEGQYGWKESKHAAGKPIGQALGEIMRGRSVDHALATFQRNLRDNIKQDDEEALKSLVAYVRQLLVRYENLRKTNITEFLRAKNALMSAIYTYTRYPKLMEVIEHEN